MMGVPTFYTRLIGDNRFDRNLVDHMRLFVSGSAPLLSEPHVQFEKITGHRILERYGMTETNMNTSNPYNGERRAGTVGLPLPGVELKITAPEILTSLDQTLIRADGPVKGLFVNSNIEAGQLNIFRDNKSSNLVISFTKGVKMVYNPSQSF